MAWGGGPGMAAVPVYSHMTLTPLTGTTLGETAQKYLIGMYAPGSHTRIRIPPVGYDS